MSNEKIGEEAIETGTDKYQYSESVFCENMDF